MKNPRLNPISLLNALLTIKEMNLHAPFQHLASRYSDILRSLSPLVECIPIYHSGKFNTEKS